MDPLDAFFQHPDSEQLLARHVPELLADARAELAKNPAQKLAGCIAEPDAADAPTVREILTRLHGGIAPPPGRLVGNLPRALVEPMLTKRFGTEPWLEQGWQPQQVLPVVVSTRDGNHFAFFGLGSFGSHSM